ncbi:MAG: quinoprotein relay system zinc metallohydrolase 2 [Betaproteobacteria bacterium]|nr:quinoprotein relay system zinc metallohydrolase 2 [Betaproteobacteria bacterium]
MLGTFGYLVSLALAAFVWVAPAGATPPDLDALKVEEIAPGNYVHFGRIEPLSHANLGDQANIGFIVGDRCVAVIDTGGSYAVGAALRKAIRQVTDKPVCYVIITHFHPDHFFGAAALVGPGVRIITHTDYRRWIAERGRFYLKALHRDLGDLAEGSEVVEPTEVVSDRKTIDIGGRTLTLQAWPAAHTTNDLTVLDERTGTLWLGDLLFVDHTPVIDGSVLGFLDVLGRLGEMRVAHYVPGHGRSELPWPKVLEPERDYLDVIVRETRAALKNRKTLEQAVDSVGLSQRANWVNFDEFHRRNVTEAYTELEWE